MVAARAFTADLTGWRRWAAVWAPLPAWVAMIGAAVMAGRVARLSGRDGVVLLMLHRRDARYGVGVLVWTVLMMVVLGVVTRLVLALSQMTGPWLEHLALVAAVVWAAAALASVLRTWRSGAETCPTPEGGMVVQLLATWPPRAWPLGLELWAQLRPAVDDAGVPLYAVARNERLARAYARFGFEPVTGQPTRCLTRPARTGASG